VLRFGNNVDMRRALLLFASLALVTSVTAASGLGATSGRSTAKKPAASGTASAAKPGTKAGTKAGKTRALNFKVRLIQEQTFRHPHPPDGNDGDTFSTTLRLFSIGTVLGVGDGTPIGTMSFNWGPLNGSCSSSAAGCSGTTNLQTITKLPGGTITAGGKNVSLAKGLIVPVVSGTGIFKGVGGSIAIAPGLDPEDVFKLTLPA
jgi:hypothetical protein